MTSGEYRRGRREGEERKRKGRREGGERRGRVKGDKKSTFITNENVLSSVSFEKQ